MNRPSPPLSPAARALLDHERSPPVQPAAVRLRAVTRARATLTAYPHPATPALARSHGTRWLTATAFTCVVAVAAGAAAYELRARFAADAAPATRSPQPQRTRIQTSVARGQPVAESEILNDEAKGTNRPAAAPHTPPPAHARPTTGTPARVDGVDRELRILRQARAAVAADDFAAALGPIAEHTRRFRYGRLAEEREALRVKALAGLGRLDDARRAAAAFKTRFPTSVLLSSVIRLAETGR